MSRGLSSWLLLAGPLALLTTSSLAVAQEPPPAAPVTMAPPPAAPAAAATEVKLELAVGEVKMLVLDNSKAWSIVPEEGLVARAVDEGHTLRLAAQKEGLYTVKIERNDGTFATYAVRVGKDSPAVAGPPIVPKVVDPNAPVLTPQSADEKYSRNTIDLNFEGGIGRHLGDSPTTIGFGRARAGVMFARWPVFTMIGATYEYNNLSPASFGLQGELLHLSGGFWGQAGGSVDIHGKVGVMAALGFSVIGAEVQYRGYEDVGYGVALIGKLRLPLGVILYAFDLNKKKTAAQ
jgi:hypothetical protein